MATCPNVIAGLIIVSANGRTFEATGTATISPRGESREGGATSSGRPTVVIKAKPITAELTFARYVDANGLDLYDLRCGVNVTIVEKSKGVTHYFNNSDIVGDPKEDLSTGELSAIQIQTDNYQNSVDNAP